MNDVELLERASFDARVFELEDIEIVRAEEGGDGRTVRAYAAVYERPVVVTEPWGETFEEIIRTGAFRKTIADKGTSFQVLFNHGRTLQGTPAERYAMPLGVPIEVTDDARGVLTVTRYAKTDLADEVLELIRSGAIRGQSFSGEWIQSRLVRAGGPRGLDRVERIEVSMREYGPTPFPVYTAAKVLSVRSQDLAEQLRALADDERAALLAQFADTPSPAAVGTGSEGPSAPTTPEPPAASSGAPDAGPSLDLLILGQAQRRRRPIA